MVRGPADSPRAGAGAWAHREPTCSSIRPRSGDARSGCSPPTGPRRPAGGALRPDVPRAGARQDRHPCAGRRRLRERLPRGGRARDQDAPEPRPVHPADGGIRRDRRPGLRHERPGSPLADVLVTDYSSSIFEWALLRRPLVLFVPDLDGLRARSRPLPRLPDRDDRDPGPSTPTGVPRPSASVDRRPAWDAFIARHLGAATATRASGSSSGSSGRVAPMGGGTLPRDVRHH